MNIEVNYKNKKRYKAKYPIRQPWIIAWLIKVISWFLLLGKDYRIEKVNTEGLKPPYILLSNHMYFIDFELAALATYPHRLHNVVSIDGYYRRPFLLELIGAICTRKFTMDLHLVRSIRKVTKRGDVLCMYPEARYSPSGVTSYIPDAIGRLAKSRKDSSAEKWLFLARTDNAVEKRHGTHLKRLNESESEPADRDKRRRHLLGNSGKVHRVKVDEPMIHHKIVPKPEGKSRKISLAF